MRITRLTLSILTGSAFLACSAFNAAQAQNVPITAELTKRLKQTRLVNEDSVIQNLNLHRHSIDSPKSFKLADPYQPETKKFPDSADQLIEVNGQKNYKDLRNGKVQFPQQPVVQQWNQRAPASVRLSEVCGFKFIDSNKNEYVLKTFSSPAEARQESYTVTHQFHCGGCSSLQDLAVYLEVRNLTTPAQKCSKKLILGEAKECYQKTIGFTESCAETWAYNSRNTRKNCGTTCMKDYGLMNVLKGKFPTETKNPDGSLRPCIQCDELNSVPGWRYAAGRSRRSSGIISDIERNPEEIYLLDYQQYYTLFGLHY